MLQAPLLVCYQAAVVVLAGFVVAWVGLVGALFPEGFAPAVVLAQVAGVVLQVEPEGKIWFEYSEVLQIIMGFFIDEPSTRCLGNIINVIGLGRIGFSLVLFASVMAN